MRSNIAHADADASNRRTESLAGLAITLTLVVIGLYLINTLRSDADIEDCVMSGHAACSPALFH